MFYPGDWDRKDYQIHHCTAAPVRHAWDLVRSTLKVQHLDGSTTRKSYTLFAVGGGAWSVCGVRDRCVSSRSWQSARFREATLLGRSCQLFRQLFVLSTIRFCSEHNVFVAQWSSTGGGRGGGMFGVSSSFIGCSFITFPLGKPKSSSDLKIWIKSTQIKWMKKFKFILLELIFMEGFSGNLTTKQLPAN